MRRQIAPMPVVDVTPAGFMEWLEARHDRILHYGETHGGAKYPVFVVAAQGGGYYAAYHSALFLARLQDQCPQFAEHTFGISSVSGGSLGAAVFSEAVRNKAIPIDKETAELTCQPATATSGDIEIIVRQFFDRTS